MTSVIAARARRRICETIPRKAQPAKAGVAKPRILASSAITAGCGGAKTAELPKDRLCLESWRHLNERGCRYEGEPRIVGASLTVGGQRDGCDGEGLQEEGL